MNRTETKLYKQLLLIQSTYFIVSGVWPLVSIKSFMAITGPKEDIWLVQTVGILIIGIGLSLLSATKNRKWNLPTLVLALTSSAGLLIVDVVFYLKGDIWAIYLLDALLEFGFVLIWIWLCYWYVIKARFNEMVES